LEVFINSELFKDYSHLKEEINMKLHGLKISLVLLFLSVFLLTACTEKMIGPVQSGINESGTQANKSSDSTAENDTILLLGPDAEKSSFSKYYALDQIDVKPKVSQYALPLEISQISNYEDFSGKILLSSKAEDLLSKNGFVVIANPFNPNEEYITSPYDTLKKNEIPIFITSDSLLHLYHIQFDETLRQIEEKEFYDKIWNIDKSMLEKSIEDYDSSTGDVKEAARINVVYFSVALSLLQPKSNQIRIDCPEDDWECKSQDATAFFSKEEQEKYTFTTPEFVKEDVNEELDLIETHEGFSLSPTFKYTEDYSQYVPRGHYTRSEKLKNYFKAFMWHGRISMLLKGRLIESKDPDKDAKIQTISASLIATHLANDKIAMTDWDRIYDVTAFYVGFSDDLGPYEYLDAMNAVLGDNFDPDMLDDENVSKLKAKLAEYRSPKIYGGTGFGADGGCSIAPPFNPEQADQCLENTKGFRFMGQRFIPDSYMFQNLVFGYVALFNNSNNQTELPFTVGYVDTPQGPELARVFPRGLDVMALLGSEMAKELIREQGDDQYDNYYVKFDALESEFDNLTVSEWNKNLYWAWLYSLKPLLQDFDEGYPTFMQTTAWQDKELITALASWTELRHDTILYAKQSYTMAGTTGVQLQPKPVVGYVEPVPEFYNRLLALTRMTNKGLEERNVLDDASKSRLKNLEDILEKLVVISKQELANEELTEEDYQFIRNFGDSLQGVITDVEAKAQKTTIVADVHTDGNSGQVLEEGVGHVDLIVVAYKVPDGRILIGAGPVMTYYEFKQPMSDRLTDEKWRELLLQNLPEMPEWTASFVS
jgi:hypothetical protein